MATYPNNYRTGVGFLPNYTFFGIIPYYVYNAELGTGAGSRLNTQIGTDGNGFRRTSSAPDGYGMKAPFPPVKAGGISAWNGPVVQLSMTGALLQGGPMEGTGSMEFTAADGALSLVISMSGNVAIATLTGDSMVLRMTVGLNGTGAFQLTGTNNLALIVPFEGAGTVLTMGAGATDLRGLLSMEGEWTPFTELSPEGLANAVWSSLAAQYNDAGTMGNKLNTASSGGVDLNALAAAVHQYALEGGYTFEEVTRIMASALAGTSQKTGSTIVFTGLDGATDRITGSFDAENNRTGVILDGG